MGGTILKFNKVVRRTEHPTQAPDQQTRRCGFIDDEGILLCESEGTFPIAILIYD